MWRLGGYPWDVVPVASALEAGRLGVVVVVRTLLRARRWVVHLPRVREITAGRIEPVKKVGATVATARLLQDAR